MVLSVLWLLRSLIIHKLKRRDIRLLKERSAAPQRGRALECACGSAAFRKPLLLLSILHLSRPHREMSPTQHPD